MSDPPVQRPHLEPRDAAWKVRAGDEPPFTWESIPDGQKFTSDTLEGLQEFLDMRAAAHRVRELEEQLAAAQTRWRLMLDAREEESNRAERAEEQLEAAEKFKAAMVRANQRQLLVVNAAVAYCSDLNNRGEAKTDDLETAIAALYATKVEGPETYAEAVADSSPAKCPNCGGYGEVMQWMYGDMEKCSKCDGSGEEQSPARCPLCGESREAGKTGVCSHGFHAPDPATRPPS